MTIGKTSSAWEKLFVKYQILDHITQNGSFKITADQIKEYREPRLMTKFDHSAFLPDLFGDNRISILPVNRNEFILSNHKIFNPLPSSLIKPMIMGIPQGLQSIDYSRITSESIAINCAAASGMIAHFVGKSTLVPTVSGKMNSGVFSFNIFNTHTKTEDTVYVDNSQIEIDAAYESDDTLYLIEAKRHYEDDFLVRQLYFPYRKWLGQVTKKVVPIYMIYSNEVFYFFEYDFADFNNYNSIRLVKSGAYTLFDYSITIEKLEEIVRSVNIVDEPSIPFPQADAFTRVIDLCELANSSLVTKITMQDEYQFDIRQSDYYFNAAKYLGFLTKSAGNTRITTTNLGKLILDGSYKDRVMRIVQEIVSHKVFNEVMKKYISDRVIPSKTEIVKVMKASHLHGVGLRGGKSTYLRRASTISGWVKWIINLID